MQNYYFIIIQNQNRFVWGLGLWCLTLHSTIFQLYHGGLKKNISEDYLLPVHLKNSSTLQYKLQPSSSAVLPSSHSSPLNR